MYGRGAIFIGSGIFLIEGENLWAFIGDFGSHF
jgi:hypothetical protein